MNDNKKSNDTIFAALKINYVNSVNKPTTSKLKKDLELGDFTEDEKNKIIDFYEKLRENATRENNEYLFDYISNLQIEEYLQEQPKDFVDDETAREKKVNTKDFLKGKYKVNDCAEIYTLKDYIEFVESLRGDVYVSRGQKYYNYNFLPSAKRTDKKSKEELSKDVVNGMFTKFKQKLLHYYPEFGKKTDIEKRALAQHFGLPTFFIDFTESHFVSLLFSIEDIKATDEDGIILFLNPEVINQKSCDINHIIDCSSAQDEKKNQDILDRSFVFLKSDYIHSRIHVQKGCFFNFPAGKSEDDAIKLIKENCQIAIIKAECKKSITDSLFELGFNFENIYPDLDNAVKSIVFQK